MHIALRQQLFDDCISLDLDQPLGVNKARDLHDRIDRANLAKEFTVHCRDSSPIPDPREQYPGAHDLLRHSLLHFRAREATELSAAPRAFTARALRMKSEVRV